MAFQEDDGALERLGELKPIDASSKASDLGEHLERHKRAIQEVAGDSQRSAERIERMVAETRAALKAIQETRSEWVPAGDASDLDRRYLLPDGTVRFARGVRKVSMPDGSTEDVQVEGLLGDPYPVTFAQREVQRRYGAFALAARLSRAGQHLNDPIVRKAFVLFRGALEVLPGKVGDFCRSMLSDPELFKRVVSNTAGSGGELVRVPQISEVRRPFDLSRRVAGLVQMKPAPAPSFKQPQKTGRVLAKRRGATSNDPARYPISTFTTSETTMTIVDRVASVLLDVLWAADATTLIGDPMGEVMDWIQLGDADTMELAFLHGDTAATHQDSGLATWTMGGYYTAGDLDGSTSPMKFWIGWRARAVDDSATVAGGGTFTAAGHFGALDVMGNRGANATVITGLHCLYTQLLQFTNFMTVDKFGPMATVINGQIGNIFGRPLIISEFITNDLVNTGLYTAAGSSTTGMLYVDPTAYTHWTWEGGAEDFDVTYPERGGRYIGQVRRSLLAPNCISTEKPCSWIYNL